MIIIDCSNNNGPVDWAKVAASGAIKGAYCKASEGTHFLDAYFPGHRRDAKAHGIPVGAYHFADPATNTPQDEARHFLAAVGGVFKKGELRPALDLEWPGHHGAPDAVAWAREFNHAINAAVGLWPLFYSFSAFVTALGARTPIGGGLWLANFGKDDGHEHQYVIPAPWRHVKLHQFTQHGHVDGVNGDCDLSHTTSLSGLVLTRDFR